MERVRMGWDRQGRPTPGRCKCTYWCKTVALACCTGAGAPRGRDGAAAARAPGGGPNGPRGVGAPIAEVRVRPAGRRGRHRGRGASRQVPAPGPGRRPGARRPPRHDRAAPPATRRARPVRAGLVGARRRRRAGAARRAPLRADRRGADGGVRLVADARTPGSGAVGRGARRGRALAEPPAEPRAHQDPAAVPAPLAGVGNIYADEALWRARVHPARRRSPGAEAEGLLVELRAVLEQGIANGGTTLRDYRTVEGEPGRNQLELAATAGPGSRASAAAPSCAAPSSTPAAPPTARPANPAADAVRMGWALPVLREWLLVRLLALWLRPNGPAAGGPARAGEAQGPAAAHVRRPAGPGPRVGARRARQPTSSACCCIAVGHRRRHGRLRRRRRPGRPGPRHRHRHRSSAGAGCSCRSRSSPPACCSCGAPPERRTARRSPAPAPTSGSAASCSPSRAAGSSTSPADAPASTPPPTTSSHAGGLLGVAAAGPLAVRAWRPGGRGLLLAAIGPGRARRAHPGARAGRGRRPPQRPPVRRAPPSPTPCAASAPTSSRWAPAPPTTDASGARFFDQDVEARSSSTSTTRRRRRCAASPGPQKPKVIVPEPDEPMRGHPARDRARPGA